MGFDIAIDLKPFHEISKPKKIYDHCWQQNMTGGKRHALQVVPYKALEN